MGGIIDMLMGWAAILMLMATFVGVPLVIIVLFIKHLCNLLKKNKQNKINPGALIQEEIKKEKVKVIIFGVLSAGVLFYIVNLINILNRPIAFM